MCVSLLYDNSFVSRGRASAPSRRLPCLSCSPSSAAILACARPPPASTERREMTEGRVQRGSLSVDINHLLLGSAFDALGALVRLHFFHLFLLQPDACQVVPALALIALHVHQIRVHRLLADAVGLPLPHDRQQGTAGAKLDKTG